MAVRDVAPFPADAPLRVWVDLSGLSAEEASALQRSALNAFARVQKLKVSFSVSVYRPDRDETVVAEDVAGLRKALREVSAELPPPEPPAPDALRRLDRFLAFAKSAGDAAGSYRICFVGKDFDVASDTGKATAQKLGALFFHFVAARGHYMHVVDLGGAGGFLSRLADGLGGRTTRPQGDDLGIPGGEGAPDGDVWVLGLERKDLPALGKPHPMRVETDVQEVSAMFPALFWRLPEGVRAPDLSSLQEAEGVVSSIPPAPDAKRLAALQRAVALDPFAPAQRLDLLREMRSRGLPAEARKLVRESAALFPEMWEFPFEAGVLCEEGGEGAAAAELYGLVTRLNPSCAGALLRIAKIRFDLAQYVESTVAYERLIDLNSPLDDAEMRYGFALALKMAGRDEDVEKQAFQSVAMDPSKLDAHLLLAETRWKLGKFAPALDAAKAGLALDGGNAYAHFIAGSSLVSLQRCAEAVEHLRLSAAAAPTKIEVFETLARALEGAGRLEECQEALSAVENIDPKKPATYMEQARIWERRGDFMSVGPALEKGCSEAPRDFQLLLRHARWLDRRGDIKRAEAAYSRALDASDAASRKEILARLSVLHVQAAPDLAAAMGALRRDGCATAEMESRAKEERDVVEAALAERLGKRGMPFPGGLKALVRFAPFMECREMGPGYLAALFAYILDAQVAGTGENPLAARLASYCREWAKFRKWLREKKWGQAEVVIDVGNTKDQAKRAGRILEYFGVDLDVDKTPEGVRVVPKLKDASDYAQRRAVLELLGVNPNLIREGYKETLAMGDEEIPVLFGMGYWYGGAKESREEAVAAWVESPASMKLYVALNEIPRAAAKWFRDHFSQTELAKDFTNGLYCLGPMLHFDENGLIQAPGCRRFASDWQNFARGRGPSDSESVRDLFTRDEGRSLYFFAALSQASPDVVDCLLQDVPRFQKTYQTVPFPAEMYKSAVPPRNMHDFADLVALLETTEKDAAFPGVGELWGFSGAVAGRTSGQSNAVAGGGTKMDSLGDQGWFGGLLKPSGDSPVLEGVRKYAVFKKMDEANARALDRQSGQAAGAYFERFGAQYQLVADLMMDPAHALRFVQKIAELDEKTPDDWRRTTFSLFQAPLALLRVAGKSGALDSETCARLAAGFLDSPFPARQVAAQVCSASKLVRDALAPALARASGWTGPAVEDMDRLLLLGLANFRPPWSILFEGVPLTVDPTEKFLQAVGDFYDTQKVTALSRATFIVDLAEKAKTSPSPAVAAALAEACSGLAEAELPKNAPDELKSAVRRTRKSEVRESVDNLVKEMGKGRREKIAERVQDLHETVAPFLADSLVSILYALEYGDAQELRLSDTNFIRKHAFPQKDVGYNPQSPVSLGGGWGQPRVMKNKVLGVFIEGGLNGLALPLSRIQGEQMEGDSSTRLGERVYATEQTFAVNAVDGTLVTEEVLAFADACMRLGEDSIAAATFSPTARMGLAAALRGVIADGRAREVLDRVSSCEFARARELLGPFDLYSIGLFFSGQGAPAGPVDWSSAGREEVRSLAAKASKAGLAQLGFPDNSWFGMNGMSLARLAPVEASASYVTPLRMAEATCDLKLRVAGLFRRMGLPATLFKPVSKALARECVKRLRQASARDWRAVIRAVWAIDEPAVRKAVFGIFEVRGIKE